jgi:hypothetical protein
MTIMANSPHPGQEAVAEAVKGALATIHTIDPDASVDGEALRRRLEEQITIFVPKETALEDEGDHLPWLPGQRASIDWRFWDRYRRLLTSQVLPAQAIVRLNDITDDILGRLESPDREGSWDRRGMVVGQVQSGKTANYVGLICKAADAGYRVIVVLAGLHESLRSQTQRRIDEGFLGFDSRNALAFNDSERNRRIGAGAVVGNSKLLPVFSYTSSRHKGDFQKGVASTVSGQVGSDPVVLVVKKNKTILENLIAWTRTGAFTDPNTGRKVVVDQPLLVIDDEADNASVNTKDIERELDESGELVSESDPATINRLIRTLLDTFAQSAYVGYTATPFANIFIWEDVKHSQYGEDLFPRSFIVRLPAPSNYIGPPQVFGISPAGSGDADPPTRLPIIRHLDDYEEFVPDKHRKDLVIGPTPPSLRIAIESFVLACAARRARGQIDVDNSMLIHVTRFVDVQSQVVDRVSEELDDMRIRIRMGEGASKETLVNRLKDLWERDFAPTTEAIDDPSAGARLGWNEIEPQLLEAVSRIQVLRINGSSADALEYSEHPDGLSVIAVGGDKLSRGLTLNGLSVSYYLRASRMYDTLMQMGRWFGYRPGYLDLCRLFTTSELEDWYRDITAANEELLEEFDAMAAAGGTPREYGLRVKKHPAGLLITARAKMRNGQEMELDFSGSPSSTTFFTLDADEQRRNFELADGFVSGLLKEVGVAPGDRGDHLLGKVPGDQIVDFLEQFRTSSRARRADVRLLGRYIRTALSHDELTEWTVGVINNSSRAAEGRTLGGLPIGLVRREPEIDKGALAVDDAYGIGQLLSPSDEWLDLDEEELVRAEALTKERFDLGITRSKSGKAPKIDAISVRHVRPPTRGLMLLYSLDPDVPRRYFHLDLKDPWIGFFISFPVSKKSFPVKYQVNNVFWQLEFGGI